TSPGSNNRRNLHQRPCSNLSQKRTSTYEPPTNNHLLVDDSVTWTAACTFKPTQTKLQIELTPPVNESTMEMSPTAIFNGTIETK
ncbi:hypothetical protein ACH4FA_34215, partial [Streptomyces sp. NPDC017966]|uniref:hypothetical protein n=1 Tax=Streptomyces sp. NPDC017966 TaxID=3365023 RepID=UPI003790DD5D